MISIRKYLPVLFIVAVVHFSSCVTCTCDQTGFLGMQFTNYNPAQDSIVTVIEYARGANFVLAPLSTTNVIVGQNGKMAYSFNYARDYKITVSPSGKTYTLTDIVQGDKPKKTKDFECRELYCSLSYKLDGKAYNYPESETSVSGSYLKLE